MREKANQAAAEELYNRITFYLNGKLIHEDVPPGLSTLDYLHKQKHMHGTKCSCNEGDCGACTVAIAYPREGKIVYEAINSCLYPVAKLHGRHLVSIEAIGEPHNLHPIQRALLEHHGTQCGYCTPGFVMSMFALFATYTHPDKETIFAALEGNLCRCTGYQSILDAASEIAERYTPEQLVPDWCREVEPELLVFKTQASIILRHKDIPRLVGRYLIPNNFKELYDYIAVESNAKLIAGGTDIMVQMNVARKEFPGLIDISRIPELNKLYQAADGLHIGAAVSYSQVHEADFVKSGYPALHKLISQIASKQIRNFGTISGNVANASPIGDSLPLLMAMDAMLRLQTELEVRHLPIREFFTGYRQTALKKGEIIREIIIPTVPENVFLRSIKSAKRKSVDISAVITAIRIVTDGKRITSAVLALGGVAATPILSIMLPDLIENRDVSSLDIGDICTQVAAEFSPLSDVRGSDTYRTTLIKNHLAIYLQELGEVLS
jgi:xanthine dehydrogenase small subunit